MWEEVANIGFRETRRPARAGILIGAQAEPMGRAFTNVALKQGRRAGKKVIGRSLICLNPQAAVEDRLRRAARRLRPALHHRA